MKTFYLNNQKQTMKHSQKNKFVDKMYFIILQHDKFYYFRLLFTNQKKIIFLKICER